MLPGLLESVRGAVDEIVLVDTGSRDETIRIAESFGARVHRSPWRDDFSAPRNLAVARARGDWILQLDADERLAPGAGETIRKTLVGADFDCGLIRLHNASSATASHADVVSGKARLGEPMSLPRLLRRTADLRYDGIVHESVANWLEARGGRVRFIDADIVHLGSTPEIRKERDKVARNVGLLKKRANAEPDDFTARSYLAFEALGAGDFEAATKEVEAGWAILARRSPRRGESVLRLAVARALTQKERGDHFGVLETTRIGEKLEGAHPDLFMMRGAAHELLALAAPRGSRARKSHLQAALAAHRGALSLASTDYMQRFLVGAGSWASETRVAAVQLQLGEAKAALGSAERARAGKPGDADASLMVAEALVSSGEIERALALLEPLLGEGPDAWVLAAHACDKAGAVDDALRFVQQANRRASLGYAAPHRKELHLDVMALVMAYSGSPSAGPGPYGALTAIMGKVPFEGGARSVFRMSTVDLRTVARNLVSKGQVALLEPLLTARAEASFPGIVKALEAALAELGMTVGRDDSPAPIIVVSSDHAVATFVALVLSAHPRMANAGAIAAAVDAAPGDETRQVFVAGSVETASTIAKTLTRAIVLTVGVCEKPPLDGSLADIEASRVVAYSQLELVNQPVETLARIFAALCEANDEASLRMLIERYPGRPESCEGSGNGTRKQPPGSSTASKEVSP